MPYILNKAKTARNLERGSQWGVAPFAYFTAGQRQLEFFAASNDKSTPYPVDLKPGATFYQDGYQALVTIQGGSGHSYLVDQPFTYTSNGVGGWYTSDRSAGRARGSTNNVDSVPAIVCGLLIPDAIHYVYVAPLDDAGNPDYYAYIDTLAPERGVHPYTKDRIAMTFKCTPRTVENNKQTGRLIPDLPTRVRILEGTMRAGRPAGSTQQDYRVKDLVDRCYAMERWFNSLGPKPGVGSNSTYTEEQLLQAGDPA